MHGTLMRYSADIARRNRPKNLHMQAAHISVGDKIWSNLPFLRPLVTIVGDTLADYGIDSEGGRVHDLLGELLLVFHMGTCRFFPGGGHTETMYTREKQRTHRGRPFQSAFRG